MSQKFRKIILYIILIKFIVALIASFGYFSHPHVIRQVDTMSVALNYWLRWTGGTTEWWFLPGSLGGGDTIGLTPMEFPILNMVLAPFFVFGHQAGFTISFIAMLFMNFGLAYIHYEEWKKVSSLFASCALMMAIFGISGTYIYRVMPDFISMILVSVACARSYKRTNHLHSYLLLTLGLLMKPTSAITLAILLMRPLKNLKNDLFWIIAGVATALSYYTFGLNKMSELSMMSSYFKVAPMGPWEGLREFFTHIHLLSDLMMKDLFIPGSLVILLFAALSLRFKKFPLRVVGLIILQIMTIFAIDGKHAYVHPYYFIGCSFLCCLLLIKLVEKAPRWIAWAMIANLIIFNGERALYRLKPLWKNTQRQQAAQLLEKIPELKESRSIKTVTENPPELGLLFGRFQGNSQHAKFLVQLATDKKCARPIEETADFRVCYSQ